MRKMCDQVTAVMMFALATTVLLAAPWLFGAWEMWWFWPLTTLLFAALLLFSVRLVMLGRGYPPRSRANRRLALVLLAGWLPFTCYALVRFSQAPVFLDAERSLLLFVTPLMLGIIIAFGFSRRQIRLLSLLLLLNLSALGLYGIINWYITRGEFVMWQPAYPQYILDQRASGSFYCPNHFAGVMAMAFVAALAVLITRHGRVWLKTLAVILQVISIWAIMLSKSRGAALSVAAVAVLAVAIGFLQWRPLLRYSLTLLLLAAAIGGGVAAVTQDIPFAQRFRRYPWRQLEYSSRYHMIAGALRAWRTSPVWGIGPGMHRHLWPHFAAGTDGDRESASWPRFPNDYFHSYEVHSDWVQLLEEYGLVGLLLFLWALGATATLFSAALVHEWRRQRDAAWRAPGNVEYAAILAALLAGAVMAVHSVGDFSLQIPAITWLLGGMAAIAVACILRNKNAINNDGDF